MPYGLLTGLGTGPATTLACSFLWATGRGVFFGPDIRRCARRRPFPGNFCTSATDRGLTRPAEPLEVVTEGHPAAVQASDLGFCAQLDINIIMGAPPPGPHGGHHKHGEAGGRRGPGACSATE